MSNHKDDDKINLTLTREELGVLCDGLHSVIAHQGSSGRYNFEALQEFADRVYALWVTAENSADSLYLRLSFIQVEEMLEDLDCREENLGFMCTKLSDKDKAICKQLRAHWLKLKGTPWEAKTN